MASNEVATGTWNHHIRNLISHVNAERKKGAQQVTELIESWHLTKAEIAEVISAAMYVGPSKIEAAQFIFEIISSMESGNEKENAIVGLIRFLDLDESVPLILRLVDSLYFGEHGGKAISWLEYSIMGLGREKASKLIDRLESPC